MSLWRKELRGLRPFVALAIAFSAFELLELCFSQVDQKPLVVTFWKGRDAAGIFLALLAFAVGTGLATRERDEGTLAFLDGLPLARSRVFFTKVLVALAVVLLYPAFALLLSVLTHRLSAGTLEQALLPGLLLESFALQALVAFAAMMLGASLGLLRSLTWMALGVLLTGLKLLIDAVPRAALLDPMALLEPSARGTTLEVDPEGLLAHALVGLVGLAVAWRGFTHEGAGRPALPSRPVVGALLATFTVASLLAAMALWVPRGGGTPGSDATDGPAFTPSPPAQVQTAHYSFSYPALSAREALALAAQADAVFLEVQALLGAPPGEPVLVDLSGSMANTLGTAFPGRIRMKLGDDARLVLAHETAHVIAHRLAQAEAQPFWDRAGVLNEGLAHWVGRRFELADDDERAAKRDDELLVLAALQARRELSVRKAADEEAFARELDDNLKYPLGAELIASLVELEGADAPGKLVRAFATPTLPLGLEGAQLWQTVFQVAGFDLARVEDHLFARVAAFAREQQELISSLPRPRVTLVVADLGRPGTVGARVQPLELPEGYELVLRFRPAPDSPLDLYDTRTTAPELPVWRAASRIQGRQVCVQPGIRTPASQVLFERWACLPVRDAEHLDVYPEGLEEDE